mgnify:CR=1 FL=1
MKRNSIFTAFFAFAVLSFAACASSTPASQASAENSSPLTTWQAGAVVTQEAVEKAGGLDACFAAEPIPDDVWARMQGKTYKENPYITRADLRHIRALHWDYDGAIHTGEMVCNAQIAECVAGIFRKLFDAHYPIQRMLLPDEYDADDETQMRDNNSSSFCYRAIAGTTKLSKHARGLAIDINTLYNPYYKDRADGTRFIQPATAAAYCDRSKDFPYKIVRGDLCYRLFAEAGFEWGGDWGSVKDFQHFEYVEPEEISALVAQVWDFAKAHPDGFTLDIHSNIEPKAGIAVSYEATQGSHSKESLEAVIRHALTHDGYVGGWLNPEDGLYYFDSTKVFDESEREKAVEFGKENKQYSAFVLSTFEDIILK